MGLVTCALFSVYLYNSPDEHPTISKREKAYIQSGAGRVTNSKLVGIIH